VSIAAGIPLSVREGLMVDVAFEPERIDASFARDFLGRLQAALRIASVSDFSACRRVGFVGIGADAGRCQGGARFARRHPTARRMKACEPTRADRREVRALGDP
jgi:hypothetical protein